MKRISLAACLSKQLSVVLSAMLIAFSGSNSLRAQTELTSSLPAAYIIQLSSENATLAHDYDDISRKNIYGICWDGTNDDNLRFAKQMGYNRIIYQSGMEKSPHASDIYFLFQKPDNFMYDNLGITKTITLSKTYIPAQQEIYKNYFALKSLTATFPGNLATGWFTFNKSGVPLTFACVQDWQQQRVIDYAVNLTVSKAIEFESQLRNFLFGGLAWDEGELTGDFSSDVAANQGKNVAVTLAFWTGGDSSRLYPGTTHNYTTISDGKAEYYKKLKTSFRDLYPDRKLIYLFEPYKINGNLIEQIEKRSDKYELLSDLMLTSEGEGNQLTQFADDASLFASGLIKRDWVGSTQPNEHEFSKIKEVVGKAGKYGSWFGWFGRLDGGDLGLDHIYQVPRWEQLARVIPSWDNLCGVPLNQRSWDGIQYLSSNSCMSNKVLYSRQPKTNKMFVVFLDPTATIPLKPGESVISVSSVDSFFRENGNAGSALKITENSISLATTTVNQVKSNPFSVSPNPAQDYITLNTNNTSRPIIYRIIDISGKLVASDEIKGNGKSIPIAKLENGVYFLRVNDEGNIAETIKFIKENRSF